MGYHTFGKNGGLANRKFGKMEIRQIVNSVKIEISDNEFLLKQRFSKL